MKPRLATRRRPAREPHACELHLSHGALSELGSQIQVPAGVHKDGSMVPPEDCYIGRCFPSATCLRRELLHGNALAEEGWLLQRIQNRPHHLQRRHRMRLHSHRPLTTLLTSEAPCIHSFTPTSDLTKWCELPAAASTVQSMMRQLKHMLDGFSEVGDDGMWASP